MVLVDFSHSFVSLSSETHRASLCSCRCAAAVMFHVAEHSQAFPSDWFALFVNAWGVMELWKGRWCFFCDFFWLFCPRVTQFEQSLSLIWRDPQWGLFFFQSSTYLRWPPFCCVFNFQVGEGCCFFRFLAESMSEVLKEKWSPVCLGPGICPWRDVCVWGCLSWVVVCGSHSKLMMSSPQVPVVLCNMMVCLFRTKDLFTRCKAEIQADSGTQAKLFCGVTHTHTHTCF